MWRGILSIFVRFCCALSHQRLNSTVSASGRRMAKIDPRRPDMVRHAISPTVTESSASIVRPVVGVAISMRSRTIGSDTAATLATVPTHATFASAIGFFGST